MPSPKSNPFINLLGKILFPKAAPWLQRKKTLILLWAVFAGLFMGGLLVVAVLMMNKKR